MGKYRSLGQCNGATIALEVAADANTLGVVASKTWMQSVHLLERVDHRCRRERVRRQPAAGICKQTSNSGDHDRDYCEPYDETRPRYLTARHLRQLIRFTLVHFGLPSIYLISMSSSDLLQIIHYCGLDSGPNGQGLSKLWASES